MATEHRNGNTDNIIKKLKQEGYRFSFFQAVSIVEKLFAGNPSPGETSQLVEERMRFRPGTGLGFPPNSILKINEVPLVKNDETGKSGNRPEVIEFILSFMGLYGVDSPLPVYFSESIVAEGEGADALKDFLDMFNHRLYSLFYQTWKKYRHYLSFKEDCSDPISQNLLCLSSLGLEALQASLHIPAGRLIASSGVLGRRFRNAEGLGLMISNYFDNIPVKVQQFIPQWIQIPNRIPLNNESNKGLKLGENVFLGETVLNTSGKFRIVLGPLDFATFLRFSTDTPSKKAFFQLLNVYTRDDLDFDVELILQTDSILPFKLGDDEFQLGVNSFLGYKPESKSLSVILN